MMSKPKRLHPAAVIFNITQTLKQSILGFLPIVIALISNGAASYLMIGIPIVIVLIILLSFLSWFRFTYQLEEDQLRIERGILVRKKRTISKHRIQSIDLSQNIIHRIFGLTKVEIETAGSDSATDAALSAVAMNAGKALHDALKDKKAVNGTDTEGYTEEQELDVKQEAFLTKRKITIQALLITGSTSASFGILIGIFGVIFSQIETLIPNHFYDEATRWLISLGMQIIIILAIIVLVFLWLLSILYTVIKDWNFTITRYEKELFITKGLLEKKQSTLPLKRIQAIGIKESPIHQLLGLVKVYVEIASGDANNRQEMHTIIFPLLRKKEFKSFLAAFLPEYHYRTENLNRLSKKALPYYLLRAIYLPLLAVITVGIFFSSYTWIPLTLMIITALYGIMVFQSTGYAMDVKQITIQTRKFSKDTALIQQHRIQALQQKQHFLHRKQSLATIDIAILNKASGRHFIIREADIADGRRITDWYSYQGKSEYR